MDELLEKLTGLLAAWLGRVSLSHAGSRRRKGLPRPEASSSRSDGDGEGSRMSVPSAPGLLLTAAGGGPALFAVLDLMR